MLRSIRPSFLTSAALLLSGAAFAGDAHLPFAEATFTEVVNDVQVVSRADAKPVKAVKDARFTAPDLVKTGRKSRAQLTAADGTIARVGSNSVFAFDKSTRQMSLESGSVLFHSPTGKGGGTIVTNSATASVIGTTIIVTATADGGFKLLVLEGVAKVTYPSGQVATLNAGQMTFVLPEKTSAEKGGQPGPILSFDLAALVADSSLVSGFENPLASREKILESIKQQGVLIEDGDLKSTGLFIVGARSGEEFLLSDPTLIIQAQVLNNAVKDTSVPDRLPESPNETVTDRLRASLKETVTFGGEVAGATPVPEKNIFRTGVRVLQDMLPTGISVPPEDLVGILVGSLKFGTQTADLSSLDGDANDITLGGLAGKTEISGDITFTGLSRSRTLRIAGGELAIADNSQLSVNFDTSAVVTSTKAEFVSLTGAKFTGVSFLNASGQVKLEAFAGDLTLDGVTVNAGSVEVPVNKMLPVIDTAVAVASNEFPATAVASPVAVAGAPDPTLILSANAGDIVVTGGSYTASVDISVEALGRVAVSDTTWYAQGVTVSAETIVLNRTSLAPGSTATLRTKDGILNHNYDGSVATEAAGQANLTAVSFSSVNDTNGMSIIWAPKQNIGDVSRPLHILDATTADYRGTKLAYARDTALKLDAASTFTPFSYLFTSDDIIGDTNRLLGPSDLGLTSDPNWPSGESTSSAYSVNGLFAKNLTIDGATVELRASDRSFQADIVAETLTLGGSITISPDTAMEINRGVTTRSNSGVTRRIELRAGTFVVKPGTVLQPGIIVNPDNTGTGTLALASLSANAFDLQDFTLENLAGAIVLDAEGDLKISQSQADAGKLVAIGGRIELSGKTVTLTNTDITARVDTPLVYPQPVATTAIIDSPVTTELVSLIQPTFLDTSAQFNVSTYLEVTGAVAVTIDGGRLKASQISLITKNDSPIESAQETTVEVKGYPDFVASTGVNRGILMEAGTIRISETIFPAGTEIRLRSGDGVLNLGSTLTGAVNFIRSVSVGTVNLVDASGLPDTANINNSVWVENHNAETNRIYVNGLPSGANSRLTGATDSTAAAIHIQQIGAGTASGISTVVNVGTSAGISAQ